MKLGILQNHIDLHSEQNNLKGKKRLRENRGRPGTNGDVHKYINNFTFELDSYLFMYVPVVLPLQKKSIEKNFCDISVYCQIRKIFGRINCSLI